jgi:hypothetical protein
MDQIAILADSEHGLVTRLGIAFGQSNSAELVLRQATQILTSAALQRDFQLQRAAILAVAAQGHHAGFFKQLLKQSDTRFHALGQRLCRLMVRTHVSIIIIGVG